MYFIDDTPVSCSDDALALSSEDESDTVAESLVPNIGKGNDVNNVYNSGGSSLGIGVGNGVCTGAGNNVNFGDGNITQCTLAQYKDDNDWNLYIGDGSGGENNADMGVGNLHIGDRNGAENNADTGVGNDVNAVTTNGRLAPVLYKDDDDWHSERRKTVRFRFKGAEGVRYTIKPTTPAEFVRLLFDDTLVDKIIEYTNKKSVMLSQTSKKRQKGRPLPKKIAPLKDWIPVTREEFFRFLGLCCLMGNIHMPTVRHYWRTKSVMYHHPFFGETMARNRFEAILRALRFYDPDRTVAKKDKISSIITHCVKNFKEVHSPAKQLSIDEALVGFKGRISYKQYIPMKRRRFGLKLYELTSSGYVLNIILYTGKGTVECSKKGHAYVVVHRLLRDYFGKGHAVYLDNYYTSIQLAESLYRRGTEITGTLRSNKVGIPDPLKKIKLRRGETFFMRKGKLLIQKWYDKREIMMISTRHNGSYRCVKTRFGGLKMKPEVVTEYNEHMGV